MMKRKIGLLCLFVVMILLVVPNIVSSDAISAQPEPTLGIGYLIIHVFTFTPGSGFHPYQGANISLRGFFFSYNGSTDENGDCFFTVHTNLLRPKVYFAKISIETQNRVMMKRDLITMFPRQIEYKNYLFIVLNTS
jgi:hypothetical protein